MSSDPKKSVLVVEDNAALAAVIRYNLERAGFRVCVGYNGREALQLAQNDQFDLVLSDQQMPEMNGVEFCQRLRQSDQYSNTPIFMLTAKGLELELPRLSEELGITATFLKPFSPAELIQAVEDHLTAVS